MAYNQQADPGAYTKHDPSLDDASMHTITASSVQAMPNMHQSQIDTRPQTSYSDTGFTRSQSRASDSRDNTPDAHYRSAHTPTNVDTDTNTGHRYESAQAQNIPRPGSGLRTDSGSQYQDQNGQRQQAQKNASVVIKVGMVGDAQIGKTSLMVKYVEGSWDEDYIQTLGKLPHALLRYEQILQEWRKGDHRMC